MKPSALRRLAIGTLATIAATLASAQAPAGEGTMNSRLTGTLTSTHDPVIMRQGDTYYVFSTGTNGRFIETHTSKDLIHWTLGKPLFEKIPDWATKAIPGTDGIWAPDISYVNGEYRLYYAISTFGSNHSVIGLATSPTLDPTAKNYRWTDKGPVVMSIQSDDYNAIDPNFIIDHDGKHWLSLGSFWTGLKLFALDPKTGKQLVDGEEPISIARRPAPAGSPAPVEAPFIVDHGGYYWLLASYDYCCKGANSTYYTVVARSKDIKGPYLGKDGSAMMEGGGTIFLRADLQEKDRFRGPGHTAMFEDKDGSWYAVYHAYDKQANGAPTLRIARVRWGADGWPVADY